MSPLSALSGLSPQQLAIITGHKLLAELSGHSIGELLDSINKHKKAVQ